MEFTRDEIIVVCISRSVQDGDIVAQGIATPIIAAAYLLARQTHAPNIYFMSAIGQGICRRPAPLGITRIEELWLDFALSNTGFVRAAADILPRIRPKEYFRPAQVDSAGNFNNIAIGKDVKNSRLRLPGTGGIPDVTPIFNGIYLYVPRHSRVTFVHKLDFLSGLGYSSQRKHGIGPRLLISDLGQFDFDDKSDSDDPHMRLISLHPGVSVTHIQSHTGFEIEIPSQIIETTPPSPEEIHILRNEIDPLGIRKLEMLSGASRKQLLREIITKETNS